jgi:hypothetical protein
MRVRAEIRLDVRAGEAGVSNEFIASGQDKRD